jgi:hypothetical protein
MSIRACHTPPIHMSRALEISNVRALGLRTTRTGVRTGPRSSATAHSLPMPSHPRKRRHVRKLVDVARRFAVAFASLLRRKGHTR